jgi:flagellar biosynthetic protein FlhB
MAENQDGQEKTEEATPRRQEEAAKKGQIVRSRELTTLIMLLVATSSLLLLGPALISSLAAQMRVGLALDPKKITDPHQIPVVLGQLFADWVLLLAPFLGVLLVVALAAPLILGGWTFSLGMKWERLDIIKGIGKLFSWNSLMELFKALIKFLVVGGVAVFLLWQSAAELLHLGREPLLPAQILGWTFLVLSLPMLLIASVDVPFQILNHIKNMRMTKQEVRDESKDTEGKPEVKARIRRLQMEFAQKRMMEKVPTADVVVTNPSHYAVAMEYKQATMAAPVIVAMGVEQTALRIRELATQHRVPLVQSPLLARALYYNGKLDKPIPNPLYRAVAQILAYLYRLRQEDPFNREPIIMEDVPVPPDLRTE